MLSKKAPSMIANGVPNIRSSTLHFAVRAGYPGLIREMLSPQSFPSMSRLITVTAPSRLHFGLFGLSQGEGRMFGGVGAMVDRPSLKICIKTAAGLEYVGPLAERVRAFTGAGRSFTGCRNCRPAASKCWSLRRTMWAWVWGRS